jgi:probable HAF family extracellular repeat protein
VAATGERGFLWHNGIITNLGDLPGGPNSSRAYKVNNQNQVVGESGVSGTVVGHAFVWQNGVVTDLQTLAGFDSSYAGGINDFGTGVGLGFNPAGDQHGFLLTPVPDGRRCHREVERSGRQAL